MFPYVHTKRNPQYGTAISSTTLLNNDSKSESFRVAVHIFLDAHCVIIVT